jgi:hypothetical protein
VIPTTLLWWMWQLNAPAILILPLFAEPRVTSGRTGEDDTMDVYAHHVVVVDQDAAAEVVRDHYVTQLRVRMKTYGYEFARLLAKIAWGRAAWDFALDAFAEVFVLPALLGQTRDMGQLVGCPPRRLGKELESAIPPQAFYIQRVNMVQFLLVPHYFLVFVVLVFVIYLVYMVFVALLAIVTIVMTCCWPA